MITRMTFPEASLRIELLLNEFRKPMGPIIKSTEAKQWMIRRRPKQYPTNHLV